MHAHANHAQFCILYAAWILALFPAADRFSIMGRKQKLAPRNYYRAPVICLALMLSILYMLIGLRRFVDGGFEIFLNDALATSLAVRSVEYSAYSFEYGLLLLTLPWLKPIMAGGYFVTTIFEALSPLALFNRWFRYAWLLVIVPFHIMTLLTMNIAFWESMILVLVLFTSLTYLFAAIPPTAKERPIVFYDGECGLCDRFIRRVMRDDKDDIFRFAPLQGSTAKLVLPALASNPADWSVVLWDEHGVHERSTATLRTLARLGGIWGLAKLLLLIPVPMRDLVYRFIARNRIRWFGTANACALPTPSERARLLP